MCDVCLSLHSLKPHHISTLLSQHTVAYNYCVILLLWLNYVYLEFHAEENIILFMFIWVFLIPKLCDKAKNDHLSFRTPTLGKRLTIILHNKTQLNKT